MPVDSDQDFVQNLLNLHSIGCHWWHQIGNHMVSIKLLTFRLNLWKKWQRIMQCIVASISQIWREKQETGGRDDKW